MKYIKGKAMYIVSLDVLDTRCGQQISVEGYH
jgi:hypothetical protein